jgi:hypothetical protein
VVRRVANSETEEGGVAYGYDDAGNQTTRTGTGIPGGSQTLECNDFNMPHRITSGDNGAAGTLPRKRAQLAFISGVRTAVLIACVPRAWGSAVEVAAELVVAIANKESQPLAEPRCGAAAPSTRGWEPASSKRE